MAAPLRRGRELSRASALSSVIRPASPYRCTGPVPEKKDKPEPPRTQDPAGIREPADNWPGQYLQQADPRNEEITSSHDSGGNGRRHRASR
jgi:hypothetical protein